MRRPQIVVTVLVIVAIVALLAHELIVTANYARFLAIDCDPANDWLTHYALAIVRDVVRDVATGICY